MDWTVDSFGVGHPFLKASRGVGFLGLLRVLVGGLSYAPEQEWHRNGNRAGPEGGVYGCRAVVRRGDGGGEGGGGEQRAARKQVVAFRLSNSWAHMILQINDTYLRRRWSQHEFVCCK